MLVSYPVCHNQDTPFWGKGLLFCKKEADRLFSAPPTGLYIDFIQGFWSHSYFDAKSLIDAFFEVKLKKKEEMLFKCRHEYTIYIYIYIYTLSYSFCLPMIITKSYIYIYIRYI